MIKKLNEVKVGDTLYCIDYKNDCITPITVAEYITNGPDVNRKIYSKEAIRIKEKVPCSPEAEGEFIIDQFYRGDICATCAYGIFTTYNEAKMELIKHIKYNIDDTDKKIIKLNKQKVHLYDSLNKLK